MLANFGLGMLMIFFLKTLLIFHSLPKLFTVSNSFKSAHMVTWPLIMPSLAKRRSGDGGFFPPPRVG